MPFSSLQQYQERKNKLATQTANLTGKFTVKKRTSSNLFRYTGRKQQTTQVISLQDFYHILDIDPQAQTLQVEGLATFYDIVQTTLEHNLLPPTAPELKHITIGGASVGIGIESACFKHGFVHDSLLEVDILLPSGKIITATADNEHADLFHALGNSYGTLGYILRAKIQLVPAKPFVTITNQAFNTVQSYVDAMQSAATIQKVDFIEGLFYSKTELFLTTAVFTDHAHDCFNIYGTQPYYKKLRGETTFFLKTIDYIFRYDPDWFWNLPETPFYTFFRKYMPKCIRNSGFYNRYIQFKHKWMQKLCIKPDDSEEKLIQDWEVPWDKAVEFTEFTLDNVDIQDQPFVALPIMTPSAATLYPLKPNTLFYNVGCYCYAKRPTYDEDFYYTKIMDRACFEAKGLKMLYSSTFIDEANFDMIYNGKAYAQLKSKYDPNGNAPTLFEKAVSGA